MKLLILIIFALTVIEINTCKDSNCINCLADPNVCKTCKPGFKTTQGFCQPCDDPNCSNCNQSQNYCSTCMPEYRSNGGRCEKCQVQHCTKCPLSATGCLECEKGYVISTKGCAARSITIE